VVVAKGLDVFRVPVPADASLVVVGGATWGRWV
jgi:hypothetical protein